MSEEARKGEKSGWILGWSGGFLWIFSQVIVHLAKGNLLSALVGIALLVTAATFILRFTPWRYPTQLYWRLMLPLYVLLFLSIAWAIWISGGAAELGFNIWSIFLILPLLLPLYLAGSRRWIDGEHKQT